MDPVTGKITPDSTIYWVKDLQFFRRKEMKKLQRLQSKENTENEMSNDFMGFVYDDELGANEIQG